MNPSPPDRGSPDPDVAPGAPPRSRPVDALEVVRLLRSAGGALIAQAVLHARLAGAEWAQEKRRLARMVLLVVAGFACLLAVMLLVAVLVLALYWDTPYRAGAVLAMIAVYGTGLALVLLRLRALSALGRDSFAATREELAADIDLIRSRL